MRFISSVMRRMKPKGFDMNAPERRPGGAAKIDGRSVGSCRESGEPRDVPSRLTGTRCSCSVPREVLTSVPLVSVPCVSAPRVSAFLPLRPLLVACCLSFLDDSALSPLALAILHLPIRGVRVVVREPIRPLGGRAASEARVSLRGAEEGQGAARSAPRTLSSRGECDVRQQQYRHRSQPVLDGATW